MEGEPLTSSKAGEAFHVEKPAALLLCLNMDKEEKK
jgi:hypothetical protein